MGRSKKENPRSHSNPASSDPKVNSPDPDGWTPLMTARARESLQSVQNLIARGADVNKADADGFRPMMCACDAQISIPFDSVHTGSIRLKDECNGDISTAIGLSPNLDWHSVWNCCVNFLDFGISHGDAAICP